MASEKTLVAIHSPPRLILAFNHVCLLGTEMTPWGLLS